ncbi:hypothetical protein MHYP_G00167550 [Metynnis hypsauchen]
MQTPHREDPGRPAGESNPGPSCCEATALPTMPPCRPLSIQTIKIQRLCVSKQGGDSSFGRSQTRSRAPDSE